MNPFTNPQPVSLSRKTTYFAHAALSILLLASLIIPYLTPFQDILPRSTTPQEIVLNSESEKSADARAETASIQTSSPQMMNMSTEWHHQVQSFEAFVTNTPLENGDRVWTLSSLPQRYLTEDGTWQAIDPTFQRQEGGFANSTNLLQISVGERTAVLRLLSGATGLGWESKSLVIQPSDGTEKPIAQVLGDRNASPARLSDDQKTLTYPNSWSSPNVWEQISSGPGQVEQSLIIHTPLAETVSVPKDAELSLRANIYLLPGMRLYTEGAEQFGSFTTASPVEVRGSNMDETLVFDPIIAYEQENPANQIKGYYRFTPTSLGEWEVNVLTPWHWWADSARNYPLVLDPTIKVKSPLTTATIYSNYPDPCKYAGYLLPSGDPVVGVGNERDCGALRSLIRFDSLPSMPPGYVIEKAELLIAPRWGLAENIVHIQTGGGVGPIPLALVDVSVYQVTSNWNPSVNWNNKPSSTSLPGNISIFYTEKPSQADKPYYVGRYVLQNGPSGIVSDWLLNPSQNYGLEIRDIFDDECDFYNNQAECEAVFIPTTPNWSINDLQSLVHPDNTSAENGGFMLQITYTPPELPSADPEFINLLPTFDSNFDDQDHAYRTPPSTSPWTAIGIKGLDEVQTGDDISWRVAGNMSLQAHKDCTGETTPSQGALTGKPNYFLVRGNPTACGIEAWVDAPDPAAPENSNLDIYSIHAVPSEGLAGNPTFTPNQHITQTVVMSTTDILKLIDLNLVDNTRVGVKILAWSYFPEFGSFPMPFVSGQVFSPVAENSVLIRDFHGKEAGGYTQLQAPPMENFDVKNGQGGTWALALDYFGDVHPVIEDPPISSTIPLTMTVQVVILSCSPNAIPEEFGCQIMEKPDGSTDYRDVGPYRIFSEGGIVCKATQCVTQKQIGNSGPYYTPFIVWRDDWLAGQQDRLVAVSGDPINFNMAGEGSLTTSGKLHLVYFPPGQTIPAEPLQITLQDFGTIGITNPADPDYGRLVPSSSARYADLPLDAYDEPDSLIKVNVDTQTAEASTPILRKVQTTPGLPLETFSFILSWHVRAEGYATTLTNITLTPQSIPPDAEVGSLTLLFGTSWDMDYRPSPTLNGYPVHNGQFAEIRNIPGSTGDGGAGAKITASPELGSKWKGVTAVIMPNGKDLPEGGGSCIGECLDVRAVTDTPQAPNRVWKMPDLMITGQANTLMFNAPGELTVFSTDHPNAQNAVSVPFSFRTFNGEVRVEMKACPLGGSTDKVPVITGDTKIALPGIGSDTNPGNMIEATFILCENALRKTTMTFNAPPLPEIPVGNTGILVNHLKGDVVVGPDYTEIKFTLNFHDESNAVTGEATVTLNTDGLFDIQADGDILAVVDYKGHAWVAWNPLDVGIDVTAWYGSWLSGQVKAHMWKGQGWQNKYPWLPDDGRTHITGSIAANIVIEKGQAFSWWFVDIPPFTISFGITVEFGEFCITGTNCQDQEWGIKGKFSIIGYDVGFYYGFKSGFNFILGSDGHKLIDQYGSATAAEQALIDAGTVAGDPLVGGNPVPFARETVPDPNASTVTAPFSVSPFAGSFIAGLSWIEGAPNLSLINPNGQEINLTNANEWGIMVSHTITHTLYGVSSPLAGTWQVKITNAAPENHYHFMYLANKKAPDVELLTPASTVTIPINQTTYNVQWTVPTNPPPGVDLRISLYYTATNTTALLDTQTYGGTIRENLPLTDGSYAWDLSSLAYGDYQVYAKIYDGIAGDDNLQPSPEVTGTHQIPAAFWIEAPGIIQLEDFVPPAVPSPAILVPIQDGFRVCWLHNTEKDLSGYVIRYYFQDVYGDYIEEELRVHAEITYPNDWQQCAHLGGFNDGEQVMVQIAAYDASGNLSGFNDLNEATVLGDSPTAPDAPTELTVSQVDDTTIQVAWSSVDLHPDGAYVLFWRRGTPQGLGQVVPSILVDPGQSTISLTTEPGFVYYFILQARDEMSRLSAPSNIAYVLLTNGADADGDGLPDDWETAYEVAVPEFDPDGDGLTNLDEFERLTDPLRFDTDGDEFSDGTEIVGGSDPLNLSSTPATYENFASGLLPLPMLYVNKERLSFYAFTGAGEATHQTISISNIGGGTLIPIISDDAPWLVTLFQGNELLVGIYKEGLTSGYYSAVLQIAGPPGSQNSPYWIPVDLWVFEGDKPLGRKVFLPVIAR